MRQQGFSGALDRHPRAVTEPRRLLRRLERWIAAGIVFGVGRIVGRRVVDLIRIGVGHLVSLPIPVIS